MMMSIPPTSTMFFFLFIVALHCITFSAAAAAGTIYTQGTTSVQVHTDEYYELVDGNNRTVNVRCATYLTDDHVDAHKFDKACFTSVFTDGNTLFECQVTFGAAGRCNRCNICVTPDGAPGYDLDCFNAQPAENTYGCDAWNDMNIQHVLVDEQFDAQPFVFNATADALLELEDTSGARLLGGSVSLWLGILATLTAVAWMG